TQTAASKTVTRTTLRPALLVAIAVGVLAVAAAFLLGRYTRGATGAATFHRITYERGFVIAARFAPDGQSVIYDAAWEGGPPHLYSTRATGPEPRMLDLQNAHLFAVSSSGEAALGMG